MAARSRRVSVSSTKSRKISPSKKGRTAAGTSKPPSVPETVAPPPPSANTPPARPTAKVTAEPPVPLTASSLPPFPTAALPNWLRVWTEAQAEALQVPTDLPALLALAVISTACAKRAAVVVRTGWQEPLNLFTLIAMPSGSRKSVLFEAATRPLLAHERAQQAHARQRQTVQATGVHERDLAHAREHGLRLVVDSPSIVDVSPDPTPEGVPQRAPAVPPPSRMGRASTPSLFVSDVTPERIGSLLAENFGRLAVLSDEGEVCEVLSGRYGGAIEPFLKGHAGTPMAIERVGRERIYVERPALTLGLAVQPDVLAGLARKKKLRDRGLLARFLVAVPPSNLGFRTVDAPPVPAPVRETYEAMVAGLLAASHDATLESEPTPADLHLSADTRKSLVAFEAEVEERLRPGGDLADISAWAAKLVGLVARLAGLLHSARLANAASTHPTAEPGAGAADAIPVDLSIIDESTVGAAITIGRYATEHAKTAFVITGADRVLEGAKTVLSWLHRMGLAEVSRRDIHQALKSHFPKADDLDRPIEALLERRWLCPIDEPATRGRGRPASARYRVHPPVRTSTQKPQ